MTPWLEPGQTDPLCLHGSVRRRGRSQQSQSSSEGDRHGGQPFSTCRPRAEIRKSPLLPAQRQPPHDCSPHLSRQSARQPVDDSVVVYLLYVTAPGPVLSGLSSHSTLRPTRGGDHLPLTCRRHPQRGNRHRRTAPGLHLTWRSVQCTMPCWQQAQLLVVSWHSSFLFCDRSERIATSLLLLFRYERRYSMMKEIPKQHFLPSRSPAHLQTFSVASPWWDCCTYSWM